MLVAKSEIILAFSGQKVLFRAKGYSRNICFNEGFVCNRYFNNSAALLRENSTNSLKVETRTNHRCKILIEVL